MAEAAVSFVADRLADALIQINLHADIRTEIFKLQGQLVWMRCFLRDADAKQCDNDGDRIRNWVSEIRNLAYDAEDLVDHFTLKLEYRSTYEKDWKKYKVFLKKSAAFLTKWKQRTKVAHELQAIRLRLQDVAASREMFGIQNVGEGVNSSTPAGEKLRKIRRSSPRDDERDIVGLEKDTEALVEKLIQQGKPERRGVSIVGMGGIGKTTLARKVYNHDRVVSQFPFRAWIFVSQKFSSRDVMLGIIRQIAFPVERLENLLDEELEEKVYECLQGMRYLVVLDDLWNTADWKCLKKAFPDKNTGSRLLLTTRNNSVALEAETVPFELQFLSKENSWVLFCRKAFVDGGEVRRSPMLEEVGEEIVDICGGLPLAIIVIGALLSRRKKPEEWERVLDNMNRHFARDPTGVSAILALSYNDLPYYLKSCFLYMGLFPEDYAISAHKLFRLWVAEGFINPENQEERMEEVAEEYLNELIERNMVQIAKKSANDRVKQCRLHDLLRDLSISKAKQENFLEIPGGESCLSQTRCRRYPIYSSSHLSSMKQSNPPLRSLLVFRSISQVRYKFKKVGRSSDDLYQLSSADFDYISSNLKLLRILELETISCINIPSTIGQLIHLTYLGLKQTNIKALPRTIGSLHNLQTLDIAGNPFLEEVPNVISKLQNLTHLFMCGHKHVHYLRIEDLQRLQTLLEIHVDEWMQNNPTTLINLRKLGIRGKFGIDMAKLFESIAELQQLRSLKLTCEGSEFPSLAQLVTLHCLIKLHLKGRIQQLPRFHEFPTKLSQITLEFTLLKEDSIEILEKLPMLSILRFRSESYGKEKLTISANGFLQLKFLEFNSLEYLKELHIGEGSIPRLSTLRVVNCTGLEKLPEEVKLVSTLQELVIEQMPKTFVDRLQGEDFHKVQHVSSITFV